jgi:histidinol phosphatase-like PHP family hydrolase
MDTTASRIGEKPTHLMNPIFESDFHVHTHHSPCAKDKFNSHPLRILAHAERLGIKVIGFADHFAQRPEETIPFYESCGPWIIDQLREELEVNQTTVHTLVGCEADQVALDSLTIDAAYAAQLDFVVLSASHFHLPGVQQPPSLEPRVVAEFFLAFLRAAVHYEFVSIIAHPFFTPGNVLGKPKAYMSRIQDAELYEIAELALGNQVAMEVNGHLDRQPGYLHAIKRFFQICREVGVKLTFGSDAHRLQSLGSSAALEDAISFLELGPDDFLSAGELLSKPWFAT